MGMKKPLEKRQRIALEGGTLGREVARFPIQEPTSAQLQKCSGAIRSAKRQRNSPVTKVDHLARQAGPVYHRNNYGRVSCADRRAPRSGEEPR